MNNPEKNNYFEDDNNAMEFEDKFDYIKQSHLNFDNLMVNKKNHFEKAAEKNKKLKSDCLNFNLNKDEERNYIFTENEKG